jgi:hypothetical protein
METWTVEPRVTAGVIGSVRLDTSRADSPEYSLDSSSSEGSYRIFRDEVLFLTREEALAVATKMAAEQQVRLTETNNLARMRKRADRPGSLVAYLRRRLGTLTKETSDTKAHIARLVQAHPRMKTDGEVTG